MGATPVFFILWMLHVCKLGCLSCRGFVLLYGSKPWCFLYLGCIKLASWVVGLFEGNHEGLLFFGFPCCVWVYNSTWFPLVVHGCTIPPDFPLLRMGVKSHLISPCMGTMGKLCQELGFQWIWQAECLLSWPNVIFLRLFVNLRVFGLVNFPYIPLVSKNLEKKPKN